MTKKTIEKDFPFIALDRLAERESYRKEVARPIYYLHKWWAKRLGSVFRAMTLGSVLEEGQDIWGVFYRQHNLKDKIVLDPFMGGGTTIGEALKLGCKAVGCDINPVSSFVVRQSLQPIERIRLLREYEQLEQRVLPQISRYYLKTHPRTGERCQVMYYFWVKEVETPDGRKIPLFSNYVFSRDAYPTKKPLAQILCPHCFSINQDRYDATHLQCHKCGNGFNPQDGPVQGQYVRDDMGGRRYKILDLVKRSKEPPSHRLYASLVITPSGVKEYLEIDEGDLQLYREAGEHLAKRGCRLADFPIAMGYNTKQAINYNYTRWRQFFNDRQLLSLGVIIEEILRIQDKEVREKFLCLFSGSLEFNNMFCSFKGEGTGAVRHIFSNHILKPERTPLENFPWGTEKSSGSFSTLFKTRLLRAQEYLQKPYELCDDGNENSGKTYCNQPLNPRFVQNFEELAQKDRSCLLLNGDSSHLPLPDHSVDAIVTDPPYFDFIHYSELADFFYAWLAPAIGEAYPYFQEKDSRRDGEVQNRDKDVFARNLAKVLREGERVLKDEGVLVFTFHHSRKEGWEAIYRAVHEAGFTIVSAFPVKAEMAVSAPKNLTNSPINLDSIIVCRKQTIAARTSLDAVLENSIAAYRQIINQYKEIGRSLSEADRLVIFMSQVICHASQHHGCIFDAANRPISFAKVMEVALEKKAFLTEPPTQKNHVATNGQREKKRQEAGVLELF